MISSPTIDEMKALILKERLESYARLWGGFPIPLAGVLYWFALGLAGYSLDLGNWAMLAFYGSGAIFPLALILAKIFKNPFMKDKSSLGTLLPPTFIGMLLFWPILIAAIKTAPELCPVVLAIGMSIHWPVIGWTYGRSFLFSVHAVVRAIIVLLIWFKYPEHSLTWIPFSVAHHY